MSPVTVTKLLPAGGVSTVAQLLRVTPHIVLQCESSISYQRLDCISLHVVCD